jgi:hypothetical protein
VTGAGLTLILLAAWLSVQGAERSAHRSTYTSTRPVDCSPPSEDVAASFAARGLTGQECPAVNSWRLFVVSSESNAWIELRRGAASWSSEEPVVYDSPIGQFPAAGGAGRVEWRLTEGGTAVALIFRVTARMDDDPQRSRSRLFVVRLEATRACLLGRVVTNQQARALADAPSTCAPPR